MNRIIEEIPVETDEQKAALDLATEALKKYNECVDYTNEMVKVVNKGREEK